MRAEITQKAKIMVALEDWLEGKPDRFGPQSVKRSQAKYSRNTLSHECGQGLEMIEYISRTNKVILQDLLEGFKNANNGRLCWDGERLIYLESDRASLEFRLAAITVMAYAIRRSWMRSVLFSEQELYDWAKIYFSAAIAGRYFAIGTEALQDIRLPIWEKSVYEIQQERGIQ